MGIPREPASQGMFKELRFRKTPLTMLRVVIISEKEFCLAGTSSGASPAVYYRGTLQANSGVLDTSQLTPLGEEGEKKKKKKMLVFIKLLLFIMLYQDGHHY